MDLREGCDTRKIFALLVLDPSSKMILRLMRKLATLALALHSSEGLGDAEAVVHLLLQ